MNFAIVAGSLLCTAISLRVYLQPGPIRNRCVRAVFLHCLANILFVRRPQRQPTQEKEHVHVVIEETGNSFQFCPFEIIILCLDVT